jgi:S-adenosylmethionine hydrolase
MAIAGSRGFLEIAVNLGNAAKRLDAGIGDAVIVDIQKA